VDWVRLEQVRTSSYATPWEPSPVAIGLRQNESALIYAIAPDMSYPSGGTHEAPALQNGKSIVFMDWPEGVFEVQWFDPATGAARGGSSTTTQNGLLQLTMPAFREDLAGRVSRK
jgi:hypothetical protein